MNVSETAAKAALELANALGSIDEEHIELFMQEIMLAKKIFVTGAGRSLLMLRCFGMRLMHVGLESYIVGDTTTPAFSSGDLLIVGSGSGETLGSINTATKAKALGGKVGLLTTRENSTLAKLCDFMIVIPAYTDKVNDPSLKKPILPGGTLFEQAMLMLGDTMVLPLAEKLGIPTDEPFVRHANLE